jgi:superfamily I DNA/RNA helicase
MGLLETLNQEQLAAVEVADGPVVIIAGPGTGKTKTLVTRVAYLLESGRAKPEQILALTFTKKAAEEMKLRLGSLAKGARPTVATFHSLCLELLDVDLPFVGDAQRLQIIRTLHRPKALKDVSARELGLVISCAKNTTTIGDPDVAKVVAAYNDALAEQEVQDFDDLLLGAYELLRDNEPARKATQARYRYVLVDEFQDTNQLQYELLKLLCGHDNLFVIGDPNQSIYGFRGASGTIFEQFRADFPNAKIITLRTNYRSVPQVVQLSNALFQEAPELIAYKDEPGLVRAVEVLNEYTEAEWILNQIHQSIGGGDLLKAVSDDERLGQRRLSDFAVLYRNRSAASTFQKLLAESGLPYQVVGDGSPYDQPQVQALVALLRAAVSNEPVQIEGYSSAECRLLEEELARVDEALPSALVEKMITILGFEPSRDLQQFVGTLVRFKDVPSALRYIDEIAEHGFYDVSVDAITLLTIHAAKGLEFPHVFVIGNEEGILPSARGDEAEERRLLYVAITRARERLELLHTRHRGGEQSAPSRFLVGISEDTLKHIVDPDMETQLRRIAKRVAKNSQTSLF